MTFWIILIAGIVLAALIIWAVLKAGRKGTISGYFPNYMPGEIIKVGSGDDEFIVLSIDVEQGFMEIQNKNFWRR